METIPLFPLTTVLFPGGKMPLQIFEPRYLDLISSSLKNESGFGVVWLREGSELHQPESAGDPRLAQVGTFARIVDWDSLPNGLLGVTIQGAEKFRLISSHQRDDKLHTAEVEWVEPEPLIPLPDYSDEMESLLAQLLDHPHIARLKLSPQVEDIATMSHLLSQLLPIDEKTKFELLSLTDPLLRMEQLMDLLDEYN
jgi:Lon protease-like protein